MAECAAGRHWRKQGVLLGVVLLIGWIFCLRTVHVALGSLVVILGIGPLAALAWVFVERRWIDLDTPQSVAWLALLILGTALGLGLSGSLIRARFTGQLEVQQRKAARPPALSLAITTNALSHG
jgi:hypothetical protein